jgi:MFS family permease
LMGPDLGWRMAYFTGAGLGLIVFVMRMWIPESPRWLMIHGRPDEAHAIVDGIEKSARHVRDGTLGPLPKIRLRMRSHTPLREVAHTLFTVYRQRSMVGLVLMAAQAFFYNAIFFTFALILTDFFGIPASHVGWYILPFAAGNWLGPLLLGRLFDTIGRRKMIAFSYGISGILLAITGWLFTQDIFTAWTLTAAWSVIFFFASAAASAGYLTVSEIFPLEIRANAISFFFAIGTGIGGIIGPALFGKLLESGEQVDVSIGYWIGAVAMLIAAVMEIFLGPDAEQKSLEEVAEPLSAKRSEGSLAPEGRAAATG